jgi:hypothetical protein
VRENRLSWWFVWEQPQWADHVRLGPPGSETPELALSIEATQAFLHWSLAKQEAGLLTMAHPERVAGLLDRIKHMEAVAKQQQRRPKLRLLRRPRIDDTLNEPIDTQDRPA